MPGSSSVVRRYDNIIKSLEDSREYRGLEYSNGLRVLLVSDPHTDKSAAAMDVAAGHLMDRWEMPGTAHFCEHMLFLGTDKYPSENEYGKFISSHAGTCNAFTSTDHTNYHFDVKPSELTGALDRFVQFFICPQFTESATEREVNAVHSEHSNNLNNDNWRLMQVERHLSKPGHDYGKFGTGDKKTLLEDARAKGIETREELLSFHKRWYSSNIMCLAVVGKESLDELETLVSECGFDRIENKDVERKFWHEHPRGENQLRKRVKIVPIKNIRSLKMSFPIPDYTEMYKCDPSHYVSHLIGHEGEGSLLSELKRRGWVSALSSYGQTWARGMAVFEIGVDLSEEGIRHTDDIVELVFQYIGMLNKNGPQEWIFKELHDTSTCRFRFKDKEHPMSLATDTAVNLQRIPFEDILYHRFDMSDFRPDLITDLMKLLVPEKLNYRIVGQEFAGQEGNTNEPVYGTEMKVEDIPQETLDRFKNAMNTPHESFHLPHPNDYIPTQFDLKPRETLVSDHPRIIYDDPWTRVWFKQDDEYNLPKMVTTISITSPVINRCPKAALLTNLYLWCLNDALAEETYAAHISGLRFNLNFGAKAFSIKVEGFDEKQPLLVKHLIERMANFKPDEIRFQTLFDSVKRGLQNYIHAQPYDQSNDYLMRLLSEQYWNKEQQLAVCEGVTAADVEAMGKDLLKAFHVEVFAHGNTTEQEVKQLATDITNILQSKSERPLFQNECSPKREHAVDNGDAILYRHFQDTHDVSAVEILFQVGVQNTEENARLELLNQLIKEPAYNQLRTTEQLGYIVWSGCRYTSGTLGLQVIVQGPKEPDFVQERIEAFLLSTRDTIINMSTEEFEQYREGLVARLLEKPKTLNARFRRFWNEIECRQYDFARKDSEVAVIKKLDKDDILKFFDQKFAAGAPERRKVAIFVHSKSQTPETLNGGRAKRAAGDSADATKCDEVTCIEQVRQTLSLYPRPRPKLQVPPFGVPLMSEKAKY